MLTKYTVPLLLVMMTLVRSGVAKAQEGDQTARAKQEVMNVEQKRNQALRTGDVGTLDRICTTGLVYINSRGELLTKAQHLAQIKDRTVVFRFIAHRDVQVRVHGSTAVVTGITTSSVLYRGTADKTPRRFTDVYVKQGGQWLCAAHVAGPMRKK